MSRKLKAYILRYCTGFFFSFLFFSHSVLLGQKDKMKTGTFFLRLGNKNYINIITCPELKYRKDILSQFALFTKCAVSRTRL